METCSKMVFLLSSDYYSGVGFVVGFLGGRVVIYAVTLRR